MTKKPWLSILIPTYNGKDHLPYALNSVLDQGDNDVECIVIDDGSTDDTLSIINKYQEKIPMKVVQRGRTGNWVANTNHALSLATGEYVCFLHQDDVWLKDRLTVMRGLTRKFPEIVLFINPSYFLDNEGNIIGLWRCPLPKYPRIINSNLMITNLLVQNFIAMPAPIIKRETAMLVHGLDETLWYTADWDFWLKVAACGDALYYRKPLSGFRVHSNSQTINRSSRLREFREQLNIVYNKHLQNWSAPKNKKDKIIKIAKFSIEVNSAMAGLVHQEFRDHLKLAISFLLLGPINVFRYFQISRITERVTARLRAQLAFPHLKR